MSGLQHQLQSVNENNPASGEFPRKTAVDARVLSKCFILDYIPGFSPLYYPLPRFPFDCADLGLVGVNQGGTLEDGR